MRCFSYHSANVLSFDCEFPVRGHLRSVPFFYFFGSGHIVQYEEWQFDCTEFIIVSSLLSFFRGHVRYDREGRIGDRHQYRVVIRCQFKIMCLDSRAFGRLELYSKIDSIIIL